MDLGTACSVGMFVPVPAVGDSLSRHDESATTSFAGEPSESLVSLDEVLPLYCTHCCWGRVWTGCCR